MSGFDILPESAAAVFALSCLWLLVRCRLGFHQVPMLMERAKDSKGRDDPYAVNWRCERCMRLSKHPTVIRPAWALKAQTYRDLRLQREAAAAARRQETQEELEVRWRA